LATHPRNFRIPDNVWAKIEAEAAERTRELRRFDPGAAKYPHTRIVVDALRRYFALGGWRAKGPDSRRDDGGDQPAGAGQPDRLPQPVVRGDGDDEGDDDLGDGAA